MMWRASFVSMAVAFVSLLCGCQPAGESNRSTAVLVAQAEIETFLQRCGTEPNAARQKALADSALIEVSGTLEGIERFEDPDDGQVYFWASIAGSGIDFRPTDDWEHEGYRVASWICEEGAETVVVMRFPSEEWQDRLAELTVGEGIAARGSYNSIGWETAEVMLGLTNCVKKFLVYLEAVSIQPEGERS